MCCWKALGSAWGSSSSRGLPGALGPGLPEGRASATTAAFRGNLAQGAAGPDKVLPSDALLPWPPWQLPVEFLLLLTVPVVDPDKEDGNWKRPLNCLHLVTSPLVLVLTLQSGACEYPLPQASLPPAPPDIPEYSSQSYHGALDPQQNSWHPTGT